MYRNNSTHDGPFLLTVILLLGLDLYLRALSPWNYEAQQRGPIVSQVKDT